MMENAILFMNPDMNLILLTKQKNYGMISIIFTLKGDVL